MTSETARPELSVVLPCYNEARGIVELLRRYATIAQSVDLELLLVDNGSTDHTADLLRESASAYGFLRVVTILKNQGYGHGIWTGLQAARGKVLAWSHADLQTDPADILRALEVYRASARPEATLVKGSRQGRSLNERITSIGVGLLASTLLAMRLHEINAQPKLFHRSFLENLGTPPSDFSFDLYVLYKARRRGIAIVEFPVQFPPRKYGISNFTGTLRMKLRNIIRTTTYIIRMAISRP